MIKRALVKEFVVTHWALMDTVGAYSQRPPSISAFGLKLAAARSRQPATGGGGTGVVGGGGASEIGSVNHIRSCGAGWLYGALSVFCPVLT
jgi:hypothetical protein